MIRDIISRLIPKIVKSSFENKVRWIMSHGSLPTRILKYIPYETENYLLPDRPPARSDTDEFGLPIPPKELRWGFMNVSTEEYLSGSHVSTMLDVLNNSGFSFNRGSRILDFGCIRTNDTSLNTSFMYLRDMGNGHKRPSYLLGKRTLKSTISFYYNDNDSSPAF
jgi:hypothetical protein